MTMKHCEKCSSEIFDNFITYDQLATEFDRKIFKDKSLQKVSDYFSECFNCQFCNKCILYFVKPKKFYYKHGEVKFTARSFCNCITIDKIKSNILIEVGKLYSAEQILKAD